MASYVITKLLSSTVSFWTSVSIRGITFLQADETHAYASGEEESDSWQQAVQAFEKTLFVVLDALAVGVLAAIAGHEASTLIERVDGDAFLLLTVTKEERTGLLPPYNVSGLAEIERIVNDLADDAELRQAAASFRESLNNAYANEIVMHLLRCAEGLARRKVLPIECAECGGQLACKSCKAELTERFMTNDAELKRILGRDLHKKYFKYPAVRHHLMHGMPLTTEIAADAEPIRAAVVAEFGTRLALKEQPAYGKAIPRYLFSSSGIFIERQDPMPSLMELIRFSPQDYLDGKTPVPWVGQDQQDELRTSF